MINYFDWIGYTFVAIGLILIAKNKAMGWSFQALGCTFMAILGIHLEKWGIVTFNSIVALISILTIYNAPKIKRVNKEVNNEAE